MNTLDWRQSPTPHRNAATIRVAALVSALALCACSPRSSDAKVADAASQERGNDEEVKGSGHLHLAGDVTADVDFAVDGCQIGKPGDGLLDGYHMHAMEGTKEIVQLSILERNYVKDGPYVADTSGASQLKEGMSSGNFGPLSLMMSSGGASPIPLSFMLTPASSLVVTISDDGAKGNAKIENMESMVMMTDMLASNGKAVGKKVSGSVTWSCGHVDRLNGEMNKAVDGMMNKLMPYH